MTVQQIEDEIRQICQELDPANTHASPAIILTWINAAILDLCSSINTLPKEDSTGITTDDTVTLPSSLLKLDYASFADANGKHTRLKTIDFNNFIRLNPGWQDTDAGIPSHIVRMTDVTWMLWPTPNTAYTGLTMTLIGSKLPTPLTLTTESPALSITLHGAIVHYGAWKFFLLLNNPERAGQEYTVYDSLRKLNLKTATSTDGSMQRFRIEGL